MPFLSNVYSSLQNELASTDVTFIAVSKTKPVEDLMDAYNAGVRDFGENYVQELVDKQNVLPKDIRWHFIGHLQTNKVKYIAPFVHLIQGVDSEKLLLEINKQGKKINRKINCLLQIYIAKEESKFGMDEDELKHIISILPELEFVEIKGLMGMASFSDNPTLIKQEFEYLNQLFNDIKQRSIPNLSPDILSMGMSADYKIAAECGSNMIRIGSMLFGERNYNK
jgi:pyridoxal phosphate enzyme (YggS family)